MVDENWSSRARKPEHGSPHFLRAHESYGLPVNLLGRELGNGVGRAVGRRVGHAAAHVGLRVAGGGGRGRGGVVPPLHPLRITLLICDFLMVRVCFPNLQPPQSSVPQARVRHVWTVQVPELVRIWPPLHRNGALLPPPVGGLEGLGRGGRKFSGMKGGGK